MIELTAVSAAVGGAKTIYETLKSILATSTDHKVKTATIELMEVVLTTQRNAVEASQTQAALLQQINEQKAEIDRLKAWTGEKERYEMKRFYPGAIAYCLKPDLAPDERPHCLCAGCYQANKKGILQATGEVRARYKVHACTSCGKETMLGGEMPDKPTPPPAPEPEAKPEPPEASPWRTVSVPKRR